MSCMASVGPSQIYSYSVSEPEASSRSKGKKIQNIVMSFDDLREGKVEMLVFASTYSRLILGLYSFLCAEQ